MHRVTTIGAGTLDALPHNGTVLLVFQISGLTHRESYFDMVMTVIVSLIIALGRCHRPGFGVRVVLTTEVIAIGIRIWSNTRRRA